MADRALAEQLEVTDPNLSWEAMIDQAKGKGYSGDSIWQYTIDAATRSRTSVNQNLGIDK
jgi:hypothetical protein